MSCIPGKTWAVWAHTSSASLTARLAVVVVGGLQVLSGGLVVFGVWGLCVFGGIEGGGGVGVGVGGCDAFFLASALMRGRTTAPPSRVPGRVRGLAGCLGRVAGWVDRPVQSGRCAGTGPNVPVC